MVDTNILVHALIKPQGSVAPILLRLRHGDYTILYTQALLEELVDVLNRPRIRRKYQLTDEDIETAVTLILLRDETVVAGKANVIISGDEDLLALDPFDGIPIVTPAEFLRQLS